MISTYLYYFFAVSLILSALFVLLASNPIESVLYLILVFLNSSFYLILIEAEFLALAFLIIYVGAIAVLFLFVVMMLETKYQNLMENFSQYSPFALIFGFLLAMEIYLSLNGLFSVNQINNYEDKYLYLSMDSMSNIQVLGQALYSEFIVQVLMAGFLLLIAMIGSILLTVNFTKDNNIDDISKQVSRLAIKLHFK